VEERKALGFKKSNHRCTRSLSCTSLAINSCRQRFEQNWFVNHRCRRRPNWPVPIPIPSTVAAEPTSSVSHRHRARK
jgi:hypothetical protein